MSANDSELPLAKVGQRQTPNAYPLRFKLKGVFALCGRAFKTARLEFFCLLNSSLLPPTLPLRS